MLNELLIDFSISCLFLKAPNWGFSFCLIFTMIPVVFEASLITKFLKPYCAAILNISKDHLDWHGSRNKYSQSKKYRECNMSIFYSVLRELKYSS